MQTPKQFDAYCQSLRAAAAAGCLIVVPGRAYPDPNWTGTEDGVAANQRINKTWLRRVNFRVINQEAKHARRS